MHAAGRSGSSTQAYAQVGGHAHARLPRVRPAGILGLCLHSFPSVEFLRNCISVSGAGLEPTVLVRCDGPGSQCPFKERCALW